MCMWGEGRFFFNAHHSVYYLFDRLRPLFAAFVLREFLIEGCLGLICTRVNEFYPWLLCPLLDKKFLSQGIRT